MAVGPIDRYGQDPGSFLYRDETILLPIIIEEEDRRSEHALNSRALRHERCDRFSRQSRGVRWITRDLIERRRPFVSAVEHLINLT